MIRPGFASSTLRGSSARLIGAVTADFHGLFLVYFWPQTKKKRDFPPLLARGLVTWPRPKIAECVHKVIKPRRRGEGDESDGVKI